MASEGYYLCKVCCLCKRAFDSQEEFENHAYDCFIQSFGNDYGERFWAVKCHNIHDDKSEYVDYGKRKSQYLNHICGDFGHDQYKCNACQEIYSTLKSFTNHKANGQKSTCNRILSGETQPRKKRGCKGRRGVRLITTIAQLEEAIRTNQITVPESRLRYTKLNSNDSIGMYQCNYCDRICNSEKGIFGHLAHCKEYKRINNANTKGKSNISGNKKDKNSKSASSGKSSNKTQRNCQQTNGSTKSKSKRSSGVNLHTNSNNSHKINSESDLSSNGYSYSESDDYDSGSGKSRSTSGEYESEHSDISSSSSDSSNLRRCKQNSSNLSDDHLSGRDCYNTNKRKQDGKSWKSEKEKTSKRNKFNNCKTNNHKSKIRSQDQNKNRRNGVKIRQKGKNQINNVVVNDSNNRRSTPSRYKDKDSGNDSSASDTVSNNTSDDDKDTNKRKKIQNKWNKNKNSKGGTVKRKKGKRIKRQEIDDKNSAKNEELSDSDIDDDATIVENRQTIDRSKHHDKDASSCKSSAFDGDSDSGASVGSIRSITSIDSVDSVDGNMKNNNKVVPTNPTSSNNENENADDSNDISNDSKIDYDESDGSNTSDRDQSDANGDHGNIKYSDKCDINSKSVIKREQRRQNGNEMDAELMGNDIDYNNNSVKNEIMIKNNDDENAPQSRLGPTIENCNVENIEHHRADHVLNETSMKESDGDARIASVKSADGGLVKF